MGSKDGGTKWKRPRKRSERNQCKPVYINIRYAVTTRHPGRSWYSYSPDKRCCSPWVTQPIFDKRLWGSKGVRVVGSLGTYSVSYYFIWNKKGGGWARNSRDKKRTYALISVEGPRSLNRTFAARMDPCLGRTYWEGVVYAIRILGLNNQIYYKIQYRLSPYVSSIKNSPKSLAYLPPHLQSQIYTSHAPEQTHSYPPQWTPTKAI